jgi:hypothetical protein
VYKSRHAKTISLAYLSEIILAYFKMKVYMRQKQSILFLLLLTLPLSVMWAQKGERASTWYEGEPSTDVYQAMDFWVPGGFTNETVRLTVEEKLPILQSTLSHLQESFFIESPGMFHYTYDQTYEGIPVYGAALKVNMAKNGRVLNFMNTLKMYPTVTLGEFGKTEQEVIDFVDGVYRKGQERFGVEVWKNYYVTSDGLLPVYKVYCGGNDISGSWELVYDANTLAEIEKIDQIVYHSPGKQAVVSSGFGYVFNPDPITTAGVTYGGTYVDGNDADATWLDDERMTVTLKDITETGGTYSLTGPFVQIVDIESPNITPSTSTDGNFFFQRSESGFEDVMCYYHTDSMQRYIQSLGFSNLGATSFRIDPHGLSGQDNSHFVGPGGGQFAYCSFGEGGVDDAEDADVITHEYGHFLSYSGSPNTNNGFERRGIDEGVGDYIAAMWSHAASTYRWDDIFTWDGHNQFWNGRSASVSGNYPPATGGWNFYAYGEVWATVLMEAHNDPAVGKTVNDKNFFQELYANVSNMTTADAARNIIDADFVLHGGAHEGTYRDIFCSRNILTGQDCVVGRFDDLGAGLNIKVFPNPARDRFTVEMDGMEPGTEYQVEVINMLGQTVTRIPAISGSTLIDASDYEAGVYWVRIQIGDDYAATEKIVVQ